MPSILNATTTSGLVTSADNSGSLQLQTNNGTTAVTIDTSQNVLAGGTTAIDGGVGVQVGNTSAGNAKSTLQLLGNTNSWIQFGNGLSGANRYLGWMQYNYASNYMTFATDSTERMRINSSGTTTVSANASADQVMYVTNTASSNPYGIQCTFLNATPNNTTNTFFIGADSTNSKILIYSSGTISNRTGTYNTISDAKLKENIVDATPKLNKLMDVKVRNYNLIGDELKQIGFVAQELEQVFPSLIDNVPDLDEGKNPTGEVTKGVKLTVMIPILVKAIQELKAELDATKAEVQALKGVA